MPRLCPFFLITFFSLFFPAIALAEFEAAEEGYFQLRGGAGVGWFSADGSEFTVNDEVDTLTFDDSDTAAAVSLGLGYVFPLNDEEKEFRWFPAVVTSIDGTYQFEAEFSGDVLLSGDPAFNNYTHSTKVQSTNLMFNVSLALAEYQRWTVFVLAGAGAAWTDVSYQDAAKPGVPAESSITLESENNTTFAFQGGAGVGFEVIPELDLTLTYLYTDLGDVDTAESSLVKSAADIDLQQQNVLLGLTWNFI